MFRTRRIHTDRTHFRLYQLFCKSFSMAHRLFQLARVNDELKTEKGWIGACLKTGKKWVFCWVFASCCCFRLRVRNSNYDVDLCAVYIPVVSATVHCLGENADLQIV